MEPCGFGWKETAKKKREEAGTSGRKTPRSQKRQQTRGYPEGKTQKDS